MQPVLDLYEQLSFKDQSPAASKISRHLFLLFQVGASMFAQRSWEMVDRMMKQLHWEGHQHMRKFICLFSKASIFLFLGVYATVLFQKNWQNSPITVFISCNDSKVRSKHGKKKSFGVKEFTRSTNSCYHCGLCWSGKQKALILMAPFRVIIVLNHLKGI